MTPKQLIYTYLKSLGFTDAGAAATIGNWQVESGLRIDAYNPGENAHGLAQWEGGRWTNLQAYASTRKLNPISWPAELGYFQQEIANDYKGTYAAMRTATDPKQAAAYFDQNFEGSSGAARTQRENNAQAIYDEIQAGKLDNAPVSTLPAFTSITDIKIPIIPGIPGGPSIPIPGTGSGSVVGGIIGPIVQPIKDIATLFKDLTWIFNVNHFIRACLYVLGAILVAVGLGLTVFGAGKDRPA